MKLIIVSGMSATGKTTLARYLSAKLGYDIIGKDILKEALFDSGVRKVNLRNWWWFERQSWMLQKQAVQQAINAGQPVILEANFFGKHSRQILELTRQLKANEVCEILCTAAPAVAYRRYVARLKTARHKGHFDKLWRYSLAVEVTLLRLGVRFYRQVLPPPRVLVVDTTHPETIDYKKLLAFVRTVPR